MTGAPALLAVDGDSLAHRAYHALPRSIKGVDGRPANAIVGFSNFLLRLWEGEQPAAVMVAWDTLEEATYRHEELEAYQSGREFDDELTDQLDALPGFISSWGFRCAKAAGYEADDFLAGAVRVWKGPISVATSDRDAFQLVSDRVTVLQPVKGVSELARIGPAEVRERYGVEPEQVPDFIALRGDSSDRIPGARGVGPKTAAGVLRQYGSLDAALEAGRFAAEAEKLRLYKRIATMDAKAPVGRLAGQRPNWARAAEHAQELGLNALSKRLAAHA